MAAAALEQSILESKDKDTLLEMAKALGVKASARLKKGEIIDKILDTTGSGNPAVASAAPTSEHHRRPAPRPATAPDHRPARGSPVRERGAAEPDTADDRQSTERPVDRPALDERRRRARDVDHRSRHGDRRRARRRPLRRHRPSSDADRAHRSGARRRRR